MTGAVVMSERKGRPKGAKTYRAVKIDASLIPMAKAIATRRGITLADLISDTIRPFIEREYVGMLREYGPEAAAPPSEPEEPEETPRKGRKPKGGPKP